MAFVLPGPGSRLEGLDLPAPHEFFLRSFNQEPAPLAAAHEKIYFPDQRFGNDDVRSFVHTTPI